MKLTTMTQVTVDGVMQGNGGATEEDRRSGFERGGWAMGVFDETTGAFISETYRQAEAFLFGRLTYELFAGYWGAPERVGHPIADALNATPKYLDHAHRPAMGEHDPSLRRSRGGDRRAESRVGR